MRWETFCCPCGNACMLSKREEKSARSCALAAWFLFSCPLFACVTLSWPDSHDFSFGLLSFDLRIRRSVSNRTSQSVWPFSPSTIRSSTEWTLHFLFPSWSWGIRIEPQHTPRKKMLSRRFAQNCFSNSDWAEKNKDWTRTKRSNYETDIDVFNVLHFFFFLTIGL